VDERRDGLLRLCRAMSRQWGVTLAVWGLAVVLLFSAAGRFSALSTSGDLRFLPENAASREAERVFAEAFDKDLLRSLVVICVRRTTRAAGLTSAVEFSEQDQGRKSDYDFIDDDLRPELERIVESSTDLAPGQSAVTTHSDKLLGPLLNSKDGLASLVVLELPYDFRDQRNAPLVSSIETLLYEDPEFRRVIPPGLEITVSGTAPVGRDRDLASQGSLFRTRLAFLVLASVVLLCFFRAPLLALTSLLISIVAVECTLGLAVLSHDWLGFNFSRADQSFVETIIAGLTLVCAVYLIARYRSRLASGDSCIESVALALRRGLPALWKGAGIVSISFLILTLTTHQKFAQTGLVLLIGLGCSLLVTATLLPACLRVWEAKIFWPRVPVDDPAIPGGWTLQMGRGEPYLSTDWTPRLRRRLAGLIATRPGTIALGTLLLFLPTTVAGVWNYGHINYGLLADLPEDSRSVTGTRAVRGHFPAGALGPTTVLLVNKSQNFLRDPAIDLLRQVSDTLYAERERLGLRDLFSVAYPLGMTEAGRTRQRELEASLSGAPALQAARRAGIRARVVKQYVGNQPPQGEHVTRINLMFDQDPFSRDSIGLLEHNKRVLQAIVDEKLPGRTELHAFGSTSAIRDMAQTTGRDQQWVLFGTFVLVLGLMTWFLRQPVITMPLVTFHLISTTAALGATGAVFWLFDPDFAGIDWKTRTLLFSVLMGISPAISYLFLERTEREQETAGPVRGVLKTLVKHGGNDAGAGLILVFTASALLWGSLATLRQLGFGLAFGMLMDTILIRMLLLPSYLILLERELFGRYSPWLNQRLGTANLRARADAFEKLSA